jgi:hypothetical protein
MFKFLKKTDGSEADLILTEELIYEKLGQNKYLTFVTFSDDDLASRTMTYGYVPETGIFFLTHKGCNKLNDLAKNPKGLLHIAQIENDISQSYDISISGLFENCEEASAHYREGFEAIGKKNPQVLGLLNSDAKEDYQLLLFRISEIRGFNYYQAISGMPKTIIKG